MISAGSLRSRIFSNLISEEVIVLLGLTAFFSFLLWPTFGAQFDLIDDHELLILSSQEIPVWDVAVKREIQIGRFRPVYYLFRFLEVGVFKTNPLAWHIATTGIGVLTTFLLFLAARGVSLDILSASVFILILSVVGDQNVIWYNLGPAETLGMLLTAVSIWAITKAAHHSPLGRWDRLALITMLLAGLIKESFVLIIPALLLLRWVLQCWFSQQTWRQALGSLHGFLIAGVTIFAVQTVIVLIVLSLSPTGYGATAAALSLASFDPRNWYALIDSSELITLARYVPLLSAIILVTSWPAKESRSWVLAGSLVVAAWIVPQLVLYESQGIGGRYLFPAIVGVAAIIAWGLSILWKRRIWIVWIACLIWLAPSTFSGINMTIQTASYYSARTLAVHQMVAYLAERLEDEQAVVIVADPGLYYESIHALGVHLRSAGLESSIYLIPVLPEGGYADKRLQGLADEMIARFSDLNVQTLDPDQVGGIIMLTLPTESVDVPAWWVISHWPGIVFSEPFYGLSLQKPGYVKAGEIEYMVLLPLSEGLLAAPLDSPVITIVPSLNGKLSISPLMKLPWWGIEANSHGRHFLWLGHGEPEGIHGTIWSTERQAIQALFEVEPGPARPDSQRTVEVTLENQAGVQRARQQFDQPTTLTFTAELQPGRNDFQLVVLDEATILRQPNGDTRPLLVLLHQIAVKPLAGN